MCTAAAFANDACVLTAIVGGTGGNAITCTETFTAGTNVFDAATFGTTTAGVDATAEETVDAIVASFPRGAGILVAVTKISANELLVEARSEGAFGYALSETLATNNNAWDTAKMREGKASGTEVKFGLYARVPNAAEVALGNMHFPLDFIPTYAQALVYTTSLRAAGSLERKAHPGRRSQASGDG